MGRRALQERPVGGKARARHDRVTALIVAAGSGERMGGGVPKQYRLLGGKPVLRWAVEALMSPAHRRGAVVIGAARKRSAAEALTASTSAS